MASATPGSLAVMVQYPTPEWVSTSGSTVMATEPLVFKSLPSTAPSHFNLQVDTASNFTTATEYRSDLGGFEYYNGSNWVSVPTEGIPSSLTSTTNVRLLTNLPTGKLYVRVRQSK